MDVDIEQLICEVEGRPALWDQRALHHNNRDIVHQLWSQVAFNCRLPVDVVRTKWKSLRDNFRQEIRKIHRGKYGDPTLSPSQHKSTWLWYRRLLFLKTQLPIYSEDLPPGNDRISPPPSEAPHPTPRPPYFYDVNAVCDTVLEEQSPENWDPLFQNHFQKLFRPLRSSLVLPESPKGTPLEGAHTGRIQKRPKKRIWDETHMYLASLLGPLGRLPRNRQLHVLESIKRLVIEESGQTGENSCI